MSKDRLKRIAALEVSRRPENPYVDPAPWLIPILEAELEGRPFSWIAKPDVELSEEAE